MQDQMYPNMESICRLCLKEEAGIVGIFPNLQVKLEKHSNMSIPMRIMSCAALEVQTHDGLPAKICSECRYQLEKSYLFRKHSQASDAKLRKHIRLCALGKTSKVFIKNSDEDDDDDEVEFHDSIDFIKEHEDRLKVEEQLKFENFKVEMRSENVIELNRSREALKAKCKEELRSEVEQRIRAELRDEIQKQLEEVMLPKMKQDCIKEARESLREEVLGECRQSEMKILLDDLQTFLKEKQIPRQDVTTNKTILTQNIRPLSPTNVEQNPVAKKPCYSSNFNKIQIMEVDDTDKTTNQNKQDGRTTVVKPELILSDSPSELGDTNMNDDDGDSDNFLIYDTDEGFEVQKKSEGSNEDAEEDAYAQDHGQAYDSSEDNLVTRVDSPKTSTTSYRIEDSENGEIKFLKKSADPLSHHQTNDDNGDQIQNANIMILNFPTEMEDEEHLELVDYSEQYDENKSMKPVILKGQPLKRYRSSEINNISLPLYTTTSTIETTLMAKTYVNTVQRPTDTPKIFKCNDCPMVFSTNSSLERHLRTHRKVEETGVTFQCPECKIVVSCASALRRHMFIHCDEKPFICKECGKAFVQKEILKRHMQTHTGIKPHQCPHCDRAFAQRINLRQHINRHHTEEPRIQQHSCHLCPKRFNHASGLSRHLASHSGVAFQCSECERTFGDRSSIKRHIANKHGNGKVPKSDKS